MIFIVLIALVAGWHPLVVAVRTAPATLRTRTGLKFGTGVVAVLSILADPILEFLSLSAPTFRTAAGTVVALTGLRWLVGMAPRRDDPDGDDLVTGVLAVLTPATVMSALALATDYGWLTSLVGLVAALAITWSIATRSADITGPSWRLAVRAVGLVAMGAGIFMLVDGIRSV